MIRINYYSGTEIDATTIPDNYSDYDSYTITNIYSTGSYCDDDVAFLNMLIRDDKLNRMRSGWYNPKED